MPHPTQRHNRSSPRPFGLCLGHSPSAPLFLGLCVGTAASTRCLGALVDFAGGVSRPAHPLPGLADGVDLSPPRRALPRR